MKSIEEIYKDSVNEAESTIPSETFNFKQKNNEGIEKNYSISPDRFKKSLHSKFLNFSKFSNVFSDHLEGQKNLIAAFASTPVSFSDAWNMKSEELNSDDVVALSKAGGHFQFNQTANGKDNSGSALYQKGFAKGLVHSKGSGLTKGFRHKTGGIYEEDSLNEMGVFQYATPTDPAGMMEYRFAERFSKNLGIPLVYIITQWFRYRTKYEPLNDWLYMTGVAKVVSIKSHPYSPIELQLISKDEGIKILNNLLDAIKTKGNFRIRPPMPEHIRLGWSYDKICRDRKKRQLIIEHAIENSFRCPGSECGNAFFRSLRQADIHIGHRISQKWNSQNLGVADVHHPYNLYLSCAKCNISLSAKYPSEIDELIDSNGTIGDWLMHRLPEG